MSQFIFLLLGLCVVAAVLSRLKVPHAGWFAAISGSLFVLCVTQSVMGILIYLGLVPLPRWVLDTRYLLLGVTFVPALALAFLFFFFSRPKKPKPGYCIRCGYDLRGTASDTCSECGQAVPRPDRGELVARKMEPKHSPHLTGDARPRNMDE